MRHILDDILGLENQSKLLTEKINRLRESLALEDDPSRKFKYEYDLNQAEEERRTVWEKIRQAYDINAPVGQSILEEKIAKLTFDDNLGRLYLVNCNRDKLKREFWDRFDDFSQAQKNFQFYFITACNSQMPQSFSERMIYELIEEELDADDRAIKIKWNGDRIKLDDLPLGRNLEKCKDKFKTYFCERFEFPSTITFEDYIQSGIPRLGYDYVATIFTLREENWDDRFIPEYLEWILDSFTGTPKNVPFFLFYFAVYMDGMHEQITPHQQKILDELDRIKDALSGVCILKPLMPVPSKDLDNWLLDIGEYNPSFREELVELYLKGLKKEQQERFHNTGQIDMDRVERLQELIYRWYQKKIGTT